MTKRSGRPPGRPRKYPVGSARVGVRLPRSAMAEATERAEMIGMTRTEYLSALAANLIRRG